MTETRDYRDTIIRISQFIIRKETETLAKDCHRALIETVLFNKSNIGLGLSEIEDEIYRQMGLKNFPLSTLNDALEDCVVKDEVYIQNGSYFLENETFEEIGKKIRERREALANFEYSLRGKVQKKTEGKGTTEDLADLALASIYRFLAIWFGSESNFIASRLRTNKQIAMPDMPMNILTEVVNEIEDDKNREIVETSIVETFETLESSSGRMLYELLQNYLHLELLNIDPECRHLQKIAFTSKTLVLDTNVLMALFLEAYPSHEAITMILSTSRDLGVRFVMTKRTEQEWLWGLERANEEFQSLQSMRPSLLLEVKNVFIRSFQQRKVTDPTLTWQSFYLQMRQIKAFAREKGIDYWYKKEFDLDKLPNKEYFEPLSGRVYACSRIKGSPKSKNVSQHDAYHLLLIRKLREEKTSDILGPSHWFLTLDTTLYCADEGLNQFMKAPFDPPSSFIADMWIPTIAPFLGPEVPGDRLADAFASLMKTHFATMVPGLSAGTAIEVLGHWLPYKSLSDKDLEAILGDAIVIRYYDELKDARVRDPKKVKELAVKLQQQVDKRVYEIFDARVLDADKKKKEAESLALVRERQLVDEKQQRILILKACGVLGLAFAIIGLVILIFGSFPVGLTLMIAGFAFVAVALGFSHFKIKTGPIEVEAER